MRLNEPPLPWWLSCRWGAYDGHVFMFAGGYAAGTPLTYNDSLVLRSTAKLAMAAGKPYTELSPLVEATGIKPIADEHKVQATCSRERPFFIDIGANIGALYECTKLLA